MKNDMQDALERTFTRLERQLVAVAEVMSGDAYSFKLVGNPEVTARPGLPE